MRRGGETGCLKVNFLGPEASEEWAEAKRVGAKAQAKQAGVSLRYVLALAAVLVSGGLSGWPVGLPPPPFISSLAWSPNGKRLATGGTYYPAGSRDNTANVWDAETGEKLLALDSVGSVSSVAWSPDGKRLATTSHNTVTVWDAETGKELLTLGVHGNFAYSGSVSSVAWSPDGTRLATGSACNTTKVWDAETGKELLTLDGLPTTSPGCGDEEAFGPVPTLGIEIRLPDGSVF